LKKVSKNFKNFAEKEQDSEEAVFASAKLPSDDEVIGFPLWKPCQNPF